MFIPVDVLFFIGWIIIGLFCSYKQYRAIDQKDPALFLSVHAFFFAPFWLIGAIFRQVIIEDWK